MLPFWTLALVISLAVLVKAAGVFTDVAEDIGLRLGVPEFVVGVTIVTVGTTLPEMVSSVVAAARGASEIAIANVVGSNVTNILLVLGVAAVVAGGVRIGRDLTRVDLPILVAAASVLALVAFDGSVSRPEAALCALGALVYLAYVVDETRRGRAAAKDHPLVEEEDVPPLGWRTAVALVASAAFLYLGATYTVESVVRLSELLGLSTAALAVSVVALGTSLPELVVGVTAARRGNLELAVGNVLGATILNSLAVVGVAGLVSPLAADPSTVRVGLPFLVVAALLFVLMTSGREVSRWEGLLLVIGYALFLVQLAGLG